MNTSLTLTPPRAAYAALTATLLAALAYVLITTGSGWWQTFAFGAAPDLALFVGFGHGLAKGQLHPRAVPLYNALHRFAGPLALGAVVLLAGLDAGWLAAALAWALHIALDRTVGYGLRTPDGFQRS
jgi:Domain of unknown function (DUF4260)